MDPGMLEFENDASLLNISPDGQSCQAMIRTWRRNSRKTAIKALLDVTDRIVSPIFLLMVTLHKWPALSPVFSF
jgi:hypothetical protein